VEEAGENPGREERRTLGATLAAERERQGLARTDVAQRLHMSPSQIEAIEHGDYEHLPKGTFLRGFVRNYAKVLNVPADPLLGLLADAKPREARPGIVVPTQNIRFDPLGERFSSPYVKAAMLALVAVAVGFAAMYWAMYVRPGRPAGPPADKASLPASATAPARATGAMTSPVVAQPEAKPPAVPAASAPPQAAANPAASSGQAALKASRPAESATQKSAAPEKTAAAASDAIPPGAKRLRFHFTGESWVEVRDARGRILLQRLNPAGSEAEIAGRPPLQVVVGNAPDVHLTYEGRDFDLEPHTNVAVARFTLE
jgi:cytoskeleton protein RodZ